MKYKDRIQAKRKYKQTIFAAATTLTLGMSALAGPTSAFAAEIPASAKSMDASHPSTYESNLLWGDFQNWVLDRHSTNLKTVVKDVHKVSSNAEPTVVFTEDHENPTDHVMSWTPGKKTSSFTDTTSISTTKEFTVGSEIEVGVELKGVGGIKGKLSFNQKLGTTKTSLHSETASVELTPTTQQIPAKETYRCTGIITKDQYTGTLKNVALVALSDLKGVITDKGDKLDFDKLIKGWNEMDPKQKAYYGLQAYYKLVQLDPGGVEGHSYPSKYQLVFDNGDTYRMNKDQMDKLLQFNDDEKQVYNIKDSTEFTLIGGYHSNWQVTNSKGDPVGY
ncbi:hypothetical protein ACLBXI_14615 [Bacillus cereus]